MWLFLIAGDRSVGAPTAVPPGGSDRPEPHVARVQGLVRGFVHVHDWKQSEECPLLRKVH